MKNQPKIKLCTLTPAVKIDIVLAPVLTPWGGGGWGAFRALHLTFTNVKFKKSKTWIVSAKAWDNWVGWNKSMLKLLVLWTLQCYLLITIQRKSLTIGALTVLSLAPFSSKVFNYHFHVNDSQISLTLTSHSNSRATA